MRQMNQTLKDEIYSLIADTLRAEATDIKNSSWARESDYETVRILERLAQRFDYGRVYK